MKIINQSMIEGALELCQKNDAKSVFISIDLLDELSEVLRWDGSKIRWIAVTQKKEADLEAIKGFYSHLIQLPSIRLSRMSFVKLTTALAISKMIVGRGDKIVFLTGSLDLETIDTLLFFEIGKEDDIVTSQKVESISESVQPEVFQHLLGLAVELAIKGREGKPVGTVFVVGDEERVMQLSKQMIINPFKGYEAEERNILNPQLKETIREFASIDGAFVVAGNGTVVTAGRYLGAAYDQEDMPRGLGSRHMAAAGITSLTKGIAIVISESTGDVRIFQGGKIIMEIEKN